MPYYWTSLHNHIAFFVVTCNETECEIKHEEDIHHKLINGKIAESACFKTKTVGDQDSLIADDETSYKVPGAFEARVRV